MPMANARKTMAHVLKTMAHVLQTMASILKKMAHVLKTVGDQDGGIAAYRRAIDLRPNFGETYYSLANLKTFRFTEQDVDAMSQRLANDSLPVECRVHFAFSLGKAFEDQKDYDRAFEHYALANQLHRDTIAYDPVQTGVAHERMREVFSADYFASRGAESGCQSADPIFIVGLPRSGSSNATIPGTGKPTSASRERRGRSTGLPGVRTVRRPVW